MKLKITDLKGSLDARINSFGEILIDETDFKAYSELADGEFVLTPRWVLRLKQKTVNKETLYSVLPVSTFVKVKYCQQDLINAKRTYCIELYNGSANVEIILGSEILTSQGAKALLEHGCIFDENNVKDLLRYLCCSAYEAPIMHVHSRFGWLWQDGCPIFLAKNAISMSGMKSEYIGMCDVTPTGSLDDWLKLVENQVLGNNGLEFVLILGFCSPVLGYLNQYTDIGTLLFNLANTSSKGKTTAAMLAASVWASPAFDKGLITTMNATTNSITEFVSHADSTTVVLDEVATGDRKEFRRLLYQLCSGRSRMRLTTDGQVKDPVKFNSCILTTAEFQIIDETAPDGVRTRVFELTDQFTKDAAQADAIKAGVYQNHAAAGTAFVEFLLREKVSVMLGDYNRIKASLSKTYDSNKFSRGKLTERVISKLAVVYQAANYFNKCFPVKVNCDEIAKMILYLAATVSSEADIADKALDAVVQYVAMNSGKFVYEDDEYYGKNIVGTIKTRGVNKEVTILKSVIEDILRENEFENPKHIYKRWMEKKLLRSERDRPYKRVRLEKSLPVQPCFIFMLPQKV